jgi:hypothetical protein
MKSLNKEFRILNLQFIISLSKKPQLKVSECPEKLSQIFVTKQKIVILLLKKSIMVEVVPMVIRMKYSELKFNQQNGSIFRGVPRDWNRRIHNVIRVPSPNSPRCTYCH